MDESVFQLGGLLFLLVLLGFFVPTSFSWGENHEQRLHSILRLGSKVDRAIRRVGLLREQSMVGLPGTNADCAAMHKESLKHRIERRVGGQGLMEAFLKSFNDGYLSLKEEMRAHHGDYFLPERLNDDFRKEDTPEDMLGPPYEHLRDPFAKLPMEEQIKKRANFVRIAMQKSWNGYVQNAWGSDELRPVTGIGRNWSSAGSQAMTIIDSLSTLYLMNMTEELNMGLDFLKHRFTHDVDIDAILFETTIRSLGGLLSIYELTGEIDKEILAVAVDLADRLLPAFNTSLGLPHALVNLKTKKHFNDNWHSLAEVTTLQLEFRTLSYHTKNPVYDMKVTHAMSLILSKAPKDMLCPTFISGLSLRWATDRVSLGANGDSFYEYLLKQYLLTGMTEICYKDAYLTAAHAIVEKLGRKAKNGWTYIAEYSDHKLVGLMDHLVCFAGGMLGLGAKNIPDDAKASEIFNFSVAFTETCVKLYTQQKSGIGPEVAEFDSVLTVLNKLGKYLLRPEALESVFYMWRLTKDPHWREVGWKMFRAIDRFCEAKHGYSGVFGIGVWRPTPDDSQQSFWLAETLKYSYLLFSDDDVLPLNEWVFNTEAHPLKIRKRDPLDIWRSYEEQHGQPAWLPPNIKGVTPIAETEMMKRLRMEGKLNATLPPDPLGDVEPHNPRELDGVFDHVLGMEGLQVRP